MPNPGKTPIVVIACKVFQHLLEQHLPENPVQAITYLEYGLHSHPRKLHDSLQDVIDTLPKPSLVVLGYGLCGNGLNGIRASKHTLLVPRADDCIAILLGSYQRYIQEFQDNPGTYYLTKGWLEAGSNPLGEYQEYLEKYGEEKAAWIMDQQYKNYRRLALVAHSQADLEKYRPQAQEVARYCAQWDMQYEEIIGSDDYVKRLVRAAMVPSDAGGEFIIVPPGGELTMGQFIR